MQAIKLLQTKINEEGLFDKILSYLGAFTMQDFNLANNFELEPSTYISNNFNIFFDFEEIPIEFCIKILLYAPVYDDFREYCIEKKKTQYFFDTVITYWIAQYNFSHFIFSLEIEPYNRTIHSFMEITQDHVINAFHINYNVSKYIQKISRFAKLDGLYIYDKIIETIFFTNKLKKSLLVK